MIDDMIGLYPAPDTLLQRTKTVTGLWGKRRKGSNNVVANCVQSRIKEYVSVKGEYGRVNVSPVASLVFDNHAMQTSC